MVGGLKAPVGEAEEAAAAAAEKGGIYFVLEDADLQVGKVGKVRPGAAWRRAAALWIGTSALCTPHFQAAWSPENE